jgi:hypothetical protein
MDFLFKYPFIKNNKGYTRGCKWLNKNKAVLADGLEPISKIVDHA